LFAEVSNVKFTGISCLRLQFKGLNEILSIETFLLTSDDAQGSHHCT
jgi:hypothetical protein